ncbi:hypothetical protein ACIQU6_43315 [Streptomyces sp. NPDC090442]|uniref:hypothetical protein n=1 Tax=Streptomyces sp. NPDC090442 TaxID=3365962 RepID=UPI00380802D8
MVSTSNALDAIVLLVSCIDSMEKRRMIHQIDAEMITALLMVVRDHIKPIPGIHSAGAGDSVSRDLGSIVSMLIEGELEARSD